jgi:hypothetical protein
LSNARVDVKMVFSRFGSIPARHGKEIPYGHNGTSDQ